MNKSTINLRLASPSDTRELCTILNEIIRVGGTTANEKELTEEELNDSYLSGDNHICCHVAVDQSGGLAGFQALGRHPKLPIDWADIATFARIEPKIRGVGSALFAESRVFAQRSGFVAVNATIRADNNSGLMYYEKMGFETYSVNKAVPLMDGTKVDRISKKFVL